MYKPLCQRHITNSVTEAKRHRRLLQAMRTNVSQRWPAGVAQMQSQQTIQCNKTGLPSNLKNGMEHLSGMSMDSVRVHYNSSKPAAVQAHAYAQGSDIHLASGQEKHLPHELGHVVQQMQGRVQATTSVGGMAVNDNQHLESEATSLGDRALQMIAVEEVTTGRQ